jgi:hypothetical protein
MDTETGLYWAGFANKKLRERIEPVRKRVLGEWRKEMLNSER